MKSKSRDKSEKWSGKMTKDLWEDFWGFWDFWDDVMDHATMISDAEPDENGERHLELANKMMVAAYAAGVWFRRGMWKEDARNEISVGLLAILAGKFVAEHEEAKPGKAKGVAK